MFFPPFAAAPNSFLKGTAMQQYQDSNYLYKGPCDDCGSSDACAVYDDGHTFCFSCKTYRKHDGEIVEGAPVPPAQEAQQENLLQGEIQANRDRGLSEDTCRKFGYKLVTYKGKEAWAAPYRNKDNMIVAQKVRTLDKDFVLVGNGKGLSFFGQHLWSAGKRLIITEGEIDCMTISQVQGHRWPVVSLPQGSGSVKRTVRQNWEYLERFEEIIACFDMDDPGQKAALDLAELLPQGKVKIVSLPAKDANDMLMAGREKELVSALWEARPYRPEGIVCASELRDKLLSDTEVSSMTYPYESLNLITRGIRKQELVTITAGSGMGKTTFVSEIAYSLHEQKHKIGLIMLEESTQRTMRNLVSIKMDFNLAEEHNVPSKDILAHYDDMVAAGDIYLFDHFGSNDIDTLCSRIRYMANVLKVEVVILDHVSLLVSGLRTNDERKLIDVAMTELRKLVQECNIALLLVSHLRRPSGDKGFEEGLKPSLQALRGSHSIAQLSDMCIGIQSDPDEPSSNKRTLWVLKNRLTGEVGIAGKLQYSRKVGRLKEVHPDF